MISVICVKIFTGAFVDKQLITLAGIDPPNSVWAIRVTLHSPGDKGILLPHASKVITLLASYGWIW